MSKAQAFKEWVETDKHLAGQHDQKVHGRRGAAAMSDHDRLSKSGWVKGKRDDTYKRDFHPDHKINRTQKMQLTQTDDSSRYGKGWIGSGPSGFNRFYKSLDDALSALMPYTKPKAD